MPEAPISPEEVFPLPFPNYAPAPFAPWKISAWVAWHMGDMKMGGKMDHGSMGGGGMKASSSKQMTPDIPGPIGPDPFKPKITSTPP